MLKPIKWIALASGGVGAGIFLGRHEDSRLAERLIGLAKPFLPFPLNVPVVRRGLTHLGRRLVS